MITIFNTLSPDHEYIHFEKYRKCPSQVDICLEVKVDIFEMVWFIHLKSDKFFTFNGIFRDLASSAFIFNFEGQP